MVMGKLRFIQYKAGSIRTVASASETPRAAERGFTPGETSGFQVCPPAHSNDSGKRFGPRFDTLQQSPGLRWG